MLKNIKKILVYGLIVIQIFSVFNVAFAEITTNIAVENTVEETNPREFTITYTLNITGETNKKPVDVVLCLDRSGSMLFRDENNKLIVDSVKVAADNFVTRFFADYPNSNLAIVSFDSNANAHDNWKYYDNASDAKKEIDFTYSYKPSKKNDPCPYVWSHWKRQSATNIGEAFAYSKRTVEKKKNSNNDNLIILFTDGVANTYSKGNGSKQSTDDYPTSPNASTEYAYNMGIEARKVADVITVGYFGGISGYPETIDIARDTLQRSQNKGFYEAKTTDDIYGVFEQVCQDLSSIGTDGKVTEVVEKEFEVIDGSIHPEPFSVTVNANGETIIVWDLGVLSTGTHKVQYRAKVKDDAYPTGQENVPVNNSIGLDYVDLEGKPQSRAFDTNQVDIPPLDGFPKVDLTITHPNIEQGGYLVGDIMTVEHGLSYINQVPFDFVSINVGEYRKILVGTDKLLNEVFTLTDNNAKGWSIVDDAFEISIYEDDETGSIRELNWDDEISLELQCIQEGNYSFNHSIDYTLINEAGNRFEYPISNLVNDETKVKKGMVSFSLVDEEGQGVEGASIIINDEKQNVLSTSTGALVVDNLTTDSYTVKIPTPSGYKFASASEGYTISDDGTYIVYNMDLNYSNPEFTKTIEFEKLDINNILVTTRDNKSSVFILADNEQVDAKVTFTVERNLKNLRLKLADTFASDKTDENITFTLESVKNIDTDVTYDFRKDIDEIILNGSFLPQGTYEAYIVIKSPNKLDNNGYDKYHFNVSVNETTFQGLSDSHEKVEVITSSELTIRLATGPRIQLGHTDDWTTETTISVSITSDEAKIIEYQCKPGQLSALAFDSDNDGEGLKNILEADNGLKVTADFTVYLENSNPANGEFVGNGTYTVYTKDEAGNEAVEVITIDNVYEVDNLPFNLT